MSAIAYERLNFTRKLLPLLLLAVAILYYGGYYDSGFDLSDDGSVALISQRFFSGERPFADVNPGYNVLWYYPIAGLFKIFGVDFLVVRIWFFALAAVSSLLVYFFLQRVAARPIISFLAALAILLVPGTSNRTWILLCVIANLWCIYELLAAPSAVLWKRRAVIAGGVLGLTFLVRIDIGYLGSGIAFPLILLSSFVGDEKWRDKLSVRGRQLALMLGMMAAVHVPFLIDARIRKFDSQMGQEYARLPRAMGIHFIKIFRPEYIASGFFQYAPPPPRYDAAIEAEAAAWTQNGRPVVGHTLLRRIGFEQIWFAGNWQAWSFAFLSYAPVAGLGILALASLAALFRGISRSQPVDAATGYLALSLLGISTITFPQFFFFRPDRSHLAEFMTGYTVASVAVLLLLWRLKGSRVPVLLGAVFFVLHMAVYLPFGLTHTYVGSVADCSGRDTRFDSPPVSVWVQKGEYFNLSLLVKTIKHYSAPSDYVVCYPYMPGINFLSERRTYQWSLYVDNTTCGDFFDKEAIGNILLYKPAVVVLNNMLINRDADSIFQVWAAPTHAFIQKNYKFRGAFMGNQIYTRSQE